MYKHTEHGTRDVSPDGNPWLGCGGRVSIPKSTIGRSALYATLADMLGNTLPKPVLKRSIVPKQSSL